MKNIVKFAVGNPVTICMVVFALLLLGKVSYDQLSVDLLPDLNNPRLFIELKAGERPPEEIEKQFVKNMESMAIRQSDVTQVSSVIKAGTARITVEYTWTKDMDEAFLDLQKAMNPFAQNKDITELKITQHDANLSPVVLVGMSHQSITDMAELRKIAESYIRNELIRLEGVAEVTLSGEEVSTLTIQTDPYKLDAFQLKIEDIASRIESNNQSISGGRPTVQEIELQQATVKAINLLVRSSSSTLNILMQNIEIALADDNSGELEKINTVLSEKQQQLVKLAHAKKDYTALADEIDLLRDKKQGLLVAKAETEGFKKRIKELEDFLKAANHELTEYDESMVRKYIEKIKVYEDKFTVCFKAGVDLDIER